VRFWGSFGTDGMDLVEGGMTVVFGIVCFFFMPDTPAAAEFLTDEEKEWALLRMRIDAGGATTATAVEEEKFDWYWAKMALKAPQTYFCSFIWFFLLVPLYVNLSIPHRDLLLTLPRASLSSSPPSYPEWATSPPPPNFSPYHPTWPPSSPCS
jgi:hypothetical protein